MALDESKLRILHMKDSSPMPGSEVFGKAVRIEREVDDPKSALIAKLMDSVFVIPCTKIRFGFDTLIGLFPGVGGLDWSDHLHLHHCSRFSNGGVTDCSR